MNGGEEDADGDLLPAGGAAVHNFESVQIYREGLLVGPGPHHLLLLNRNLHVNYLQVNQGEVDGALDGILLFKGIGGKANLDVEEVLDPHLHVNLVLADLLGDGAVFDKEVLGLGHVSVVLSVNGDYQKINQEDVLAVVAWVLFLEVVEVEVVIIALQEGPRVFKIQAIGHEI